MQEITQCSKFSAEIVGRNFFQIYFLDNAANIHLYTWLLYEKNKNNKRHLNIVSALYLHLTGDHKQLLFNICVSVCVCGVCRSHTCDQNIFSPRIASWYTTLNQPHFPTQINKNIAWWECMSSAHTKHQLIEVDANLAWPVRQESRRWEVEASFKLGNYTNEHLAVKCKPHNKEPSFVYIQQL